MTENRWLKSGGLSIQTKDRFIFKLRLFICLTRIIQRIIRLQCEYGHWRREIKRNYFRIICEMYIQLNHSFVHNQLLFRLQVYFFYFLCVCVAFLSVFAKRKKKNNTRLSLKHKQCETRWKGYSCRLIFIHFQIK